jgi:hypothetical protein
MGMDMGARVSLVSIQLSSQVSLHKATAVCKDLQTDLGPRRATRAG